MSVFKNLYLTDRVFYILGSIVFLYFLSFFVHPVFYFALGLLVLLFIVICLDIYLLFKQPNLSAERRMATIFSLHDKNKVALTITNKTDSWLKVKIIDELPYQFNERDFSISIGLDAQKVEILEYILAPKIRGEYSFGNINCIVQTKIGLARKREIFNSEKMAAVYPSIVLMMQQELIAMKHPSFTQGDRTSRRAGKSYEFDQIKNYVDGDDTRNINWKASSTLNKLMVNHFEDERSQQIYSIIDKSRVMKMPFNDLTLVDYAINSTLAFSNIVLKKQDKAGLITFAQKVDTSLKADRGAHHLKKIMYSLYKEKYDYSEANYEALYSTIRKTITNRSLIFLYTNFDSIHSLERNIKILKMINKYHSLIVVFFENSELETFIRKPASSVLEIYQKAIGKKSVLEKALIVKELRTHGIYAIKSTPEKLSINTINQYLELKSNGLV